MVKGGILKIDHHETNSEIARQEIIYTSTASATPIIDAISQSQQTSLSANQVAATQSGNTKMIDELEYLHEFLEQPWFESNCTGTLTLYQISLK